jgi:2-keto-4-pentenoate hydratase/2-oxohepta-3-ene-1,7-dioic acid hydratase in catechol pathway
MRIKEDYMKFARFEFNGNEYQGVVRGEEVAVLKGSFLDRYEETGTLYPLSEVRLLPPVVPTKIVCVGQNYLGHIEELGVPVPKEPHVFFKPPSCLVGHEDAIIYPRGAERVDYEGELAVVIREKMRDVPEDEVINHVLGWSCFNDVTERALVSGSPFMLALAKGFDTFGPFGPYIVTDLDPDRLELKTYLNGKVVQQDNTKNCVFSVKKILSYVSSRITLYPGDIVSTGTPKGIGPMRPGDVVEVEIEGIGSLKNIVKNG